MDVFGKRTENLIKIMKMKGFLNDPKVEEAIRQTHRHFFVPKEFLEDAYEDEALPTKHGQTISQPSVVVRMTEWLDVREGNKILEIGCGSGWQSAILSKLAGKGKIYSIDMDHELIKFASENHKKSGIKNVEIREGDGSLGLLQEAPFDRIIITAAAPQVPKPLAEQLREGGLLVAPVGKGVQSMVLYRKSKQKLEEVMREGGYVFVPLLGKYGFKESEL